MKNIIIVILLGISAFLAVSLFYLEKKNIVTEIEGMGNLSYATARGKTAAAADKKGGIEIKIAVIGNFAHERFNELQKGITLASDEINKAGGVNGRKIKLVIKDNQGKLSRSKLLAQELAADTGITALICGFNYMEFLSISPICEYNGLLLMSPVVTSDILPDQGSLKMVFTNYPDIDTILKVMYDFLKINNLKSTAIISPPEYHYGYYFANAFDSHIQRDLMGTTGVVRRDICYESAPQLIKKTFKVWDPKATFDNMLICGGPEIVKNVIPFAAELNPESIYMLTDEMEIKELTQAEIGKLKIFLPSVYDRSSEKKANKLFCENFKKSFGHMPDIWSAQGYDTLKVIAAAMKEAKTTVPSKLTEALYKIKYTENVSTAPYIAFDDSGQITGSAPVIKYPENGEFKVLKNLDLKEMTQDSGKNK